MNCICRWREKVTLKDAMAENLFETAKSVLLALLVLSSILLSLGLWLQGAPVSSLPPALIDAAGSDLREHIPSDLFQPVVLVYHDGRGSHRVAPHDEDPETVDLLEFVLASLVPGNIRRVPDDEGLDQILIRRQLDRTGATVLLPGLVPMNLWMKALGAPEGFPPVMMDRLFFFLSTDEMMNLYIPTAEGWYHTEWTVVDGLVDDADPGSIVPPARDLERAGYETRAVSLWASRMQQGAEDRAGEPVVLLLGWRDLALSPLLSIPEMDVEVTTYMAEPVLSDATEHVVSLFSDLTAVRQRTEPDRSTSYTDGYRSLRITATGTLTYTLVTPPDAGGGDLSPDAATMLRKAWGFLRNVLGDKAGDLRLTRVEPVHLRAGLDREGEPPVAGYEFQFSQIFADGHLVAVEGPVSVRVDGHGVRRAALTLLRPAGEVQKTLAITPISAVERCYRLIGEEGDPVVQRINLVYYPSDEGDDPGVVRPAWLVDLGSAGQYLVDAVSADITIKK